MQIFKCAKPYGNNISEINEEENILSYTVNDRL